MTKKEALDCTKCGAPLSFTSRNDVLDCPYCGTKHKIEVSGKNFILVEIHDRVSNLEKEIVKITEKSIGDVTLKVKQGEIIKGTIINISNYGVLVEIEPGLIGKIHISQLDKEFIKRGRITIKQGEKITAQVMAIDTQTNSIMLSNKAAT